MKLDRAKLALSISVASIAIPREAHAHGPLAGERDETQAMSDELVVEDGGVDLDLDEVDRDGGDFGDHDAAEGVGHGYVGVAKLELGVVVFELADLHLWESLVSGTSVHV